MFLSCFTNCDADFLARLGTTYFFCQEGILQSTWAVTLANIQDHLHVNDGQLGLAVMMSYLLQVTSAPISSLYMKCVGCSRSTMTGSFFFCIALVCIAFANSFATLMLTFSFFGFTLGIMDTSMNASAVIVEYVANTAIMGNIQGSYSLAAVVGSVSVSPLLNSGWSSLQLYLFMASVCLLFATIAGNFMFSKARELEIIQKSNDMRSEFSKNTDSDGNAGVKNPTWNIENDIKVDDDNHSHDSNNSNNSDNSSKLCSLRNKKLAVICALGFVSIFSEGITMSWLVIYMKRYIVNGVGLARLGYSVYYACEAFGRFNCDFLRISIGKKKLVFVAAIFCVLGISLLLSSSFLKEQFPIFCIISAYFAIILMGLGISVLIPTVISSAGEIPGLLPGTSVATATFWMNAGSIVGPPLVGTLSYLFDSLRCGLIVLLFSSCFILILSFFLDDRDSLLMYEEVNINDEMEKESNDVKQALLP